MILVLKKINAIKPSKTTLKTAYLAKVDLFIILLKFFLNNKINTYITLKKPKVLSFFGYILLSSTFFQHQDIYAQKPLREMYQERLQKSLPQDYVVNLRKR